MTNEKIPKKEGELLNIIAEKRPLEWRKYGQRKYLKLISGDFINGHFEEIDCSNEPPFIAFRFENESRELIDKLQFLIENYQGRIKWELYEHKRFPLPKTNWAIRPRRVSEVEKIAEKEGLTSEQYLASYEPQLSIIAFEDLNDLTQYIKENI